MNGYGIREVLGEMVSVGEDRQIAANVLHSLSYAEAHVRYFGGPIVTLEAKFTEMAPAWLTKVIALNRLNLILNEASIGIMGVYATPIEVLTYLQPRPTMDRMACQVDQSEIWSVLYAYLSEAGLPGPPPGSDQSALQRIQTCRRLCRISPGCL